MSIDAMIRSNWILVTIVACAVLLFGNNIIAAQEEGHSSPSDSSTQQSQIPDEQEAIKGYPVRKRRIGGPTDGEWDLDNSFPKQGSLMEMILRCPETQRP
jgi:hypothetical protein